MASPKFKKLREVSEDLGIPIKSLRREIYAGRLRVFRARPSSNSPILISEEAVNDWLENYASQRQLTPPPSFPEKKGS